MINAPASTSRAFTPEQQRAIRTRDVSVALSAGAGCGKTFVLTERFLDYFRPGDEHALHPSQLRRLVAITFTERAAREMRERIRGACHQRLLAADDSQANYWLELIRGLDNARISTIHSFCAALLRFRAVEAGIDPTFEVLEQAQAETLLSETIDDRLRRLIAERDEGVFELFARFDVHGLAGVLRRLASDSAGYNLSSWLEISPEEQLAIWAKFHQDEVVPAIARQIADLPWTRQIVHVLGENVPNNETMQARRELLLAALHELNQEHDARQLSQRLVRIRESAQVKGGGLAKAWSSAEIYEQFKVAASKLRERLDYVAPLLAFDPRAAHNAAAVGKQLLSIAAQVERDYADRKRQLGALDFDDLLIRTSQLLADPARADLRRRLSEQIDLLLVDEFQDTDPRQVELIRALCDDAVATGKLFLVGDFKQSIYRFRGADPVVFRRLRNETPHSGRLSLTRNFRSQPALLQFVNALFWDDLGADYEPLRANRDQVTPTPAVEFLFAASGDTKESRDLLRRREADWIARRIRQLIDSQEKIVWDPGANGLPEARAAQAGDFAVLFRALTGVEYYEEALRRHDIDYYLVGGHAFYSQQEIFDVVNLLRTLNSPCDLVSLVGVLRSGMFSLSDETIYWLAQDSEGLWNGLAAERYPQPVSVEQQERARFAATTISELRSLKDRLRICELINLAMARTGYDAMLMSEFLGRRKLANLRKLVEQARRFDRPGAFGLTEFIAQLSEFVAEQPKEALAAVHAEDANVVRLMTIHQSKGLEFPIVIVPDVDSSTSHRTEPGRFDPRLGPLVKRPSDANDESIGGYELWDFVESAEDLAELYRLLYVATTRAADYLILASGVPKLGGAGGPWTQLLARRFDLETGNMIARLPAGEAPPEIRITTREPVIDKAKAARSKRVELEAILGEVELSAAPGGPLPSAIEPVPPDLAARRQFSFSRLAGTLDQEPGPVEGDETNTIGPHDARDLGMLAHAVLAAIDFREPGDIRKLVRIHAERMMLLDSTLETEALEMIERFVASPRARQLADSQEPLAEVEFLLAWPPGDKQSKVMFNGYLDRLDRDAAGNWHVLDFKTNRVPAQGVSHLVDMYVMQMLVYALATEQILGVAPKSITLHFLRTGDEHEFSWNEAARERVAQLVDRGIAAAVAPRPITERSTYRIS